MSYGRIQRGPMAADNFTQIHNALFRDPRLSAKAKGIFGFISTHRDGWGVTPESIASAMADGVASIRSGLKELEAYGYLVRSQPRRPNGTVGPIVYYITDQPSSEPVADFQQPDVTCENVESSQVDGHLRRSQPVVDFPHADEPHAVDRTHKKTNSKNISLKNTTSPSGPVLELVPPSAGDLGGGGGDAPQQQEEQDPAAVAFVDRLPYRGKLPGPRQQAHLVARVSAAFAAGWSEWALRAQLTEETESAKSLAAVYRHRLEPENLPAAPPLPRPRTSENTTPQARKGKCPECHRPLRNSTEDALCSDCREDVTA